MATKMQYLCRRPEELVTKRAERNQAWFTRCLGESMNTRTNIQRRFFQVIRIDKSPLTQLLYSAITINTIDIASYCLVERPTSELVVPPRRHAEQLNWPTTDIVWNSIQLFTVGYWNCKRLMSCDLTMVLVDSRQLVIDGGIFISWESVTVYDGLCIQQ